MQKDDNHILFSRKFVFFLSVRNKIYVKNPKKNQFLSFPIISSSNEPRVRASHWGMNTSGIGHCQIFSIFFLSVRNEIHGKNPKKINFWVFQLYLVQMNPGDVLVIGEWTLLELGNVTFFRIFSKCQKWIYGKKTQKIYFWVFQLYLAQINPGNVLVIGEWTLLELGNVKFFRIFSKCQKWNLRKIPEKIYFWVLPIYLVQ